MLRSIRNISVISTTPSIQTLIPPTTAPPNHVNAEILKPAEKLDNAEFETMGTPTSVVNIRTPPSVPVYVRKNALLSIYGASVSSKLQYLEPVKRLLYGGFASAYLRLISTVPFSVLVSANSGKNDAKSFATLVLDGKIDWAVLDPRALQAYTGVHVTTHLSPKYVSVVRGSQTGLFSLSQLGHTLISGRGQVALAASGSVYKVALGPAESILVNRANLLGLSVNGSRDLATSVAAKAMPKEEMPKPDMGANFIQSYAGIHSLPISPVEKVFKYFSVSRDWVARAWNGKSGLGDFVRVSGPRSVLLSSGGGGENTVMRSSGGLGYAVVRGVEGDNVKRI